MVIYRYYQIDSQLASRPDRMVQIVCNFWENEIRKLCQQIFFCIFLHAAYTHTHTHNLTPTHPQTHSQTHLHSHPHINTPGFISQIKRIKHRWEKINISINHCTGLIWLSFYFPGKSNTSLLKVCIPSNKQSVI